MISAPVVAGVLVLAAAATAITISDGRAVAGALFVALLASPFAASPLPGGLEIAARVVAALLAAYVLWIVMRGGAVKSEGSAIGIGAELAIAAAAYVVGWWLEPVHPLQGPLSEQATGFSLVALAVLPLSGSNVLRAGIGVMLLALGMSFVMEAWLGPSPALAQLALTALLLVVPAALAILVDVDDEVAKVVPATEKQRPELPRAPQPVEPPPFVPSVLPDAPSPRTARVAAAEGSADQPPARAPEVVVGPRPSIRFLGRNAPVRGESTASPASQAKRSGSAPGRAAGLGRRIARLGSPRPTDEEAAPEIGEAEAGSIDGPRGAGPGGRTATRGGEARRDAAPGSGEPAAEGDEARIRDGRDPRNPRLKRPLR